MHTLTPSIDRLGAALRALRQTHERDRRGEDPTVLGAKCLHVLVTQLAAEGLPPEDLQPLIDLEAALRAKLRAKTEMDADRRRRKPPSEVFLARVAAVIDLLVKGGYDEGDAAQVIMRRLMAAGIPPPQQGGDARGWKRLLSWRTDLNHGLATSEAQDEYRDFTRLIESIPPGERIKRVLDEQLWDRRRSA